MGPESTRLQRIMRGGPSFVGGGVVVVQGCWSWSWLAFVGHCGSWFKGGWVGVQSWSVGPGFRVSSRKGEGTH
jgi:hypothetical protein